MLLKLFWFVVASLAVYRCASIVTSELGPFDIFESLRNWSKINAVWLWKGLKCFSCTSVWFGAFFSIFLADTFAQWLIYTFAVSALALFIYTLDALISKRLAA